MTHEFMPANDAARQDIVPYQFEGHTFSIVDCGGEPWFIAAEVARELAYREAYDLTRTLDQDEKGPHTVRTPGGEQVVTIISEPGLYRAVVQRKASRKNDEKLLARIGRFQRWVFHDVLPSIRKTGSYGAAQPVAVDYTNPQVLLGCFRALEAQVAAKDVVIADLTPKAEVAERIAGSEGAYVPTVAAKMLQLPPIAFCEKLRTLGWTRKNFKKEDIAFQPFINKGYLKQKITTGTRDDGTTWSSTQVMVTARGLTALARIIPEANRGML